MIGEGGAAEMPEPTKGHSEEDKKSHKIKKTQEPSEEKMQPEHTMLETKWRRNQKQTEEQKQKNQEELKEDKITKKRNGLNQQDRAKKSNQQVYQENLTNDNRSHQSIKFLVTQAIYTALSGLWSNVLAHQRAFVFWFLTGTQEIGNRIP